ncbi:hypothetical protein [Pseudonocardia sp. ICBG601]|uniref:hypothetical protein n=1 Tax=Pseudonocardia sp. ICBG601 TaxID=2846759 RepID=UPI001CF6B317|nr:hypothetical protein [Pseudonocardia sp. ICBG601]
MSRTSWSPAFHGRLGDPEQQVLLAGDPLELLDQLLGHPDLGAGVDPVHGGDQQLDQRVGDLPFPAVQQRRQQGQRHLRRVSAQVAGRLDRRPRPPGGDHLRGDVGEHAG